MLDPTSDSAQGILFFQKDLADEVCKISSTESMYDSLISTQEETCWHVYVRIADVGGCLPIPVKSRQLL